MPVSVEASNLFFKSVDQLYLKAYQNHYRNSLGISFWTVQPEVSFTLTMDKWSSTLLGDIVLAWWEQRRLPGASEEKQADPNRDCFAGSCAPFCSQYHHSKREFAVQVPLLIQMQDVLQGKTIPSGFEVKRTEKALHHLNPLQNAIMTTTVVGKMRDSYSYFSVKCTQSPFKIQWLWFVKIKSESALGTAMGLGTQHEWSDIKKLLTHFTSPCAENPCCCS